MGDVNEHENQNRPTTQQEAITQPKVKVQRPKLLEQLFHKTRQKRSVYYFTNGRKINDKKYDIFKNSEENKNPFELPPIDNLLLKRSAIDKERELKDRSTERRKKVHEKHTYRTRSGVNLSERLYVPVEGEIPEGIVDIDKQFFTIVKGRPLKEKKLDLRKYIQNCRDGLLSRLKAGFVYDEIYLLERQQYTETKTINQVKTKLQEYMASFDEFLAKDNDRSMALLRESSEEAAKTSKKKEELNIILEEFVKLKCQMYGLEDKWAKGKVCKDFLQEISPKSFRDDYETKSLEYMKEDVLKYKNKIKLSNSLESLLGPFLEDDSKLKPTLYFTKPWQLRFIFRDMELQNQNALLYLERLRRPNEIALLCLKLTNDYYENEISKIEDNLADLEKVILSEEERAKTLKEKATKMVDKTFKNVIKNKRSILLHAHVQNVYEACISSDGDKLSVLGMLHDLEVEYKILLLELDKLPIECVKEAKNKVKSDTAYVFGRAKDSRKKINYLDILVRRIIRAVEPPLQKTTRPLVFRSEPPEPVIKLPAPPKELTPEELERIHFFTDKTAGKFDDTKLYYPLGY